MQIDAGDMLIIVGQCADFGKRADLQGGSRKPESIDTWPKTRSFTDLQIHSQWFCVSQGETGPGVSLTTQHALSKL